MEDTSEVRVGAESIFPKSVSRHYDNVGRLRCVVTDRPDPSLHHCHGGSMAERLRGYGLDSTKGLARRGYGDALIIPLAPELHYLDSGQAIDGSVGVRTWEARWGSQANYVDEVSDLLGYDLWELHAIWSEQREKFRKPTGNI